MPPRPPLTTLVMHTWKEHGKPRPFRTKASAAQAAKARISRSISHDAQLARRLHDRDGRRRTCALPTPRSISYEEGLTTANHVLTPPAHVAQQPRDAAAPTAVTSSASAASVSARALALVDFSPVSVPSLPTIPELESLSSLSPPAINASKITAINASKITAINSGTRSTPASQKRKPRLRRNRSSQGKGRTQSQKHASLIERSCSFDADLSAIADAGLERSCGIAPNL